MKKKTPSSVSFAEKVRAIVKKIPKGKTMTYAEVARKAGSPHAYRAVGAVMRSNKDTSIPCHRVIGSDGSMRGYNGLQGKSKLALLKKEGAL